MGQTASRDARSSSATYTPRAGAAAAPPGPAGAPPLRLATSLLALVFVLSGAAGLVYESIWSRYLSLFVGHSAYAQVIVLVIFLGGMSLGALLVGERSARVRQPLLWYAAVELLVGVIGLAFHDVFVWATAAAYHTVFPALAGGVALTVAKWAIAGVLILPQSILLGMTFPLMSAGVMRLREARVGHTLGLLYFTNSLGAAIGVLVAGFVLIERVGLPGTLVTAAILNFVAAVVVWALLRFGVVVEGQPLAAEPARSSDGSTGSADTLARLLLAVSFGTALSSFIYEIGWIRMLSLVLGSATHSFELMLSAFILGLALGALWVRRRADGFRDPVRALGVVQWAMGALAIATLPVYLASFDWTSALLATLGRTDAGYRAFGLARYAMCLLVMLPATFCAGMTLPLITKTLVQSPAGERAIGRVYGVNTFGSIVGAALAGLVLMPLLGLKTLLIAGAAIDLALGAVLLATVRRRGGALPRPTRVVAIATAALVGGVMLFTRFDHSVLVSGVYRHGLVPRAGAYRFPFYEDGRTATVSVRTDPTDTLGTVSLATNGKPDASLDRRWLAPWHEGQPRLPLTRDQATQVMVPIITLAHAPHARTAAVIGQGSGMTSHFLLGGSELERVYTIEIEPQMIRGSRQFYPANKRVFDDPRSTFVIDDAKSFFAATNKKFDVIVSEPSNPWVSGVSGLFTEEFYRRVQGELTPTGVFGQWLHLYEINDDLVLTVLAAMDRVFPDYEVFLTSSADMVVVASNQPVLPPPDWTMLQRGGIAEDLRKVVPMPGASLEATRLVNRRTLHPYLRVEGQANSDYYPLLDLGTERTRFLRTIAGGLLGFGVGRIDVAAALSDRRVPLPEFADAPAPEVQKENGGALGFGLRQLWAGAPTRLDTVSSALARESLYRMRRLQQQLAIGAPPSNWRLWMNEVARVEDDLHGGSAGAAWEPFHGAVRAYLARTHAPAEAVAAAHFLHGIAAWDWNEAGLASGTLIAAAERGDDWIPLDVLREGSVLAHVKVRDSKGARAVFKALSRRTGDGNALRDRVLAAAVLELEQPSR